MTAPRSSDALNFDTLLRAAVRAARSGNLPAARALTRALTRDNPREPRAWVALAGVAETREEQRAALEQALALDPHDERVQRALARLQPASTEAVPPAPVPVPEVPVAAPVTLTPTPHKRSLPRWLVPLVLLLLLLPTLGYAMTSSWRNTAAPEAAATPTLASSIIGGSESTQTLPLAANSTSPPTEIASIARPTQQLPTTQALLPTQTVPPVAPPTHIVPAVASVAPGTMLALDDWQVSLPRQDYTLMLDGSIGDTAPRGRFVLALVALANTQEPPRRIPADLFVLIDNRGRTYNPQPALSTTYLNTFGRAQRGDLSMEDEVPGGSGFFSIPVVFDVPADAIGLRLSLGDGSVGGWDVAPGT